MKCLLAAVCLFFSATFLNAQAPLTYNSSEIFQQLQKLPIMGNVLYIAAHPDDENTRLLSYLVNERHLKTGYLSITRGDGGQNLIGGELGIDLGLIRTQELLAARRIDGAEQFFTRAYDFGYSKSPEEALKIWGHQNTLSDVVRIIRKFKPDVIIARFPSTGEGGHGHHTASAILAREAFDAAADPMQFREQLKGEHALSVWKTKRLLWNSFNFGNNNTQRPDQFQLEVGMYNPIMGKGYGEIAAESRSQHRSQGFGRSAERGSSTEFFAFIAGDDLQNDLMDGVDLSWNKIGLAVFQKEVDSIVANYDFKHPAKSLPALHALYQKLEPYVGREEIQQKRKLLLQLIESVSGLFFQAYTNQSLVSVGDSLPVFYEVLNRNGVDIPSVTLQIRNKTIRIDKLIKNEKKSGRSKVYINKDEPVYQPYFLKEPKKEGHYIVEESTLIGNPENEPLYVNFAVEISGKTYLFKKPLQYKYTDPVRGEMYEPLRITYPLYVSVSPTMLILKNDEPQVSKKIRFTLQANTDINERMEWNIIGPEKKYSHLQDTNLYLQKAGVLHKEFTLESKDFQKNSRVNLIPEVKFSGLEQPQHFGLREIRYEHIPPQQYHYIPELKVVKMDLKTSGSRAGYIAGAGDKIPEALEQMGYRVTLLNEENLTPENIKSLDVIITGVRAYNIHEWLSKKYAVLMEYMQQGGVLFVQYNTNNSIGPVKANMAPYPLEITRTRITDENAEVRFLQPKSSLMHFPNTLSDKDFEGWVQERSIYHATDPEGKYEKLFEMNDPGEAASQGALLVAPYGKGRFVYSGFVFFRELPAAVPGAYRLFANLIAIPKN